MLAVVKHWLRSRAARPYVRPWGLAAPVAVLLVCLPLLRPLIHPADISDNERERLATVESIVERHSLMLAGNSFGYRPHMQSTGETPVVRGTGPATGETPVARGYGRQPPVFAGLLAGPYWVVAEL